jgi:Rad3-related DNA helicase
MESPGKVLCSPSSKEGLDLKDDLCRFQIILKVPWGDLADKVVQARMKEDPIWYANEAVKNLEQAYGRGMRSKTDWCDCYILDQSFQRLLFQNYDLLSKYFREAIII